MSGNSTVDLVTRSVLVVDRMIDWMNDVDLYRVVSFINVVLLVSFDRMVFSIFFFFFGAVL